jgi:rhamnulokinase
MDSTQKTALTRHTNVAAVDLGASGGRVMVGRTGPGCLELREAHRFPNVPVRVGGTLYWDILRLYSDVLDGLRVAALACGPVGRAGPGGLASVGIDSWASDYGLLDETGTLLGNPVHYRDARTADSVERVLARVPAVELYETTGIQQLPINTLCQLTAAADTPQLAAARTLLLIPDLMAYWLTGETGAEVTNASTTWLYDVRARSWAWPLMERAGIPARLFPPLRQPGDAIGPVLPDVAADQGLPPSLPIVTVGSHDTASAVAAVPASGRDFAYISCGTWSLVGMELDKPVLTEASRRSNFTNETGIDGRIRYLRNVTGLWLLQESLRTWAVASRPADLEALLAEAAQLPTLTWLIDPDDPAFLPPGNMPARIADACRRAGGPMPQTAAETVRCILDSLALAYRRVIADAQELSGRQTSCTSSAAGQGTTCCASSPQTPAGFPWLPARWRPPRWATSSSRPARSARHQRTWRACALCCAPPSPSSTSPPVTAAPHGRPPNAACPDRHSTRSVPGGNGEASPGHRLCLA